MIKMLNARKINKILLVSICFISIFGSSNVAFALSSFSVVGDYIPQEDEFYSLNINNITCDLQAQNGGLAIFEDDELYSLTNITWCDYTEDILIDLIPNKKYLIVNYDNELEGCDAVPSYPDVEDTACYISTYSWTSPALTTLTSGILFGRSGESQQAIQNPVNMVASVGVATSGVFNSVFPYLMLSAGVIIVFYITQKLAMTLSLKTEKKRGWTAEGATQHEVNEFKKKKRSRIKRGLPLE